MESTSNFYADQNQQDNPFVYCPEKTDDLSAQDLASLERAGFLGKHFLFSDTADRVPFSVALFLRQSSGIENVFCKKPISAGQASIVPCLWAMSADENIEVIRRSPRRLEHLHLARENPVQKMLFHQAGGTASATYLSALGFPTVTDDPHIGCIRNLENGEIIAGSSGSILHGTGTSVLEAFLSGGGRDPVKLLIDSGAVIGRDSEGGGMFTVSKHEKDPWVATNAINAIAQMHANIRSERIHLIYHQMIADSFASFDMPVTPIIKIEIDSYVRSALEKIGLKGNFLENLLRRYFGRKILQPICAGYLSVKNSLEASAFNIENIREDRMKKGLW